MAPAEVTEDYYAVLEIAPNATLDTITKSYRRLALLRHPDRNLLGVNATATFQLVRSSLPVPLLTSHTSSSLRSTILTRPKRMIVEESKDHILILTIMNPLASSKMHTKPSLPPPSAGSTTAYILAPKPATNPPTAALLPRKPKNSAPPLWQIGCAPSKPSCSGRKISSRRVTARYVIWKPL